jgi:hypothetical protein
VLTILFEEYQIKSFDFENYLLSLEKCQIIFPFLIGLLNPIELFEL